MTLDPRSTNLLHLPQDGVCPVCLWPVGNVVGHVRLAHPRIPPPRSGCCAWIVLADLVVFVLIVAAIVMFATPRPAQQTTTGIRAEATAGWTGAPHGAEVASRGAADSGDEGHGAPPPTVATLATPRPAALTPSVASTQRRVAPHGAERPAFTRPRAISGLRVSEGRLPAADEPRQPPRRADDVFLPTVAAQAVIPPSALSGTASWYRYRPGQAAAGPRLRAWLGAAWRGRRVVVTANGRSVVVTLTDFMVADRLVDLDRANFAQLANPAVGLVRATITQSGPTPTGPPTDTEGGTP